MPWQRNGLRALVALVATTAAWALAPATADALSGQCGSYALPSGVRVQLFENAQCGGGSVAVGTSGNGDRSDFRAFANIDGRTLDFNDRVTSIAVRRGSCVRVFENAGYGGAQSGLLCASTADGGYATSTFDNKISSMRVCRIDAQSYCEQGGGGAAPPPPAPPSGTGTPGTAPAPGSDPGSTPAPAPAPGTTPAPACRPSIAAGLLRASSACFTTAGTVFTSAGPVRVNGVDISPNGGSKISIDTKTFRVRSTGSVTIKAGPVPLRRGIVDFVLSKQVELGTAPGAKLMGLPVQGNVKLTFTPGAVSVDAMIELEQLGGITGQTQFSAGMDGFTLNGVKVTAGETNLGGLKVSDIQLEYKQVEGGFRFMGSGLVALPGTGGDIGGEVGFGSGGYFSLGATVDNLNRPLFDGVFLQRISIGFSVNPYGVRGSLGLTAGPQVSIVGEDFRAARVDGGFEYDSSGPGSFAINGKAELVGYDVGEAQVKYQFDGKLDFSGKVDLEVYGSGFSGQITGWVDGASAFNAEGDGGVKVAGKGFSGGEGIISSRGFGACRRGFGPDFGFGYRYGASFPDVVFSSCGIGPFRQERATRTFRQAGGGPAPFKTFGVGKGVKTAAFAAIGTESPPQVTITDPRGAVLAQTPDAPDDVVDQPKVTLFRDAGAKTTYIVVDQPAAGLYKLSLETGSGPVSVFRAAESLPAPDVRASIRGRGRTRTLSYRIAPQRGQVVRFYEQGRDTRRFIAATGRRRGTARFAVPDGRPGRREVVAVVEQDGVPRATGTVASYNAPPPRRPATPRKVRIRATRGQFVVTWGGAARAAGYEVRVYVGDGRRLQFFPGRLQRSIVVPGATKGLRANVTVRGLTATNRRGPRGRDATRAR